MTYRSPFISLTEAVTKLGLNNQLSSDKLSSAIAANRFGMTREEIYRQLTSAAQALCNAAIDGRVEIWGDTSQCCGPSRSPGSAGLQRLQRDQLVNYRQYMIGSEALWFGAVSSDSATTGEDPSFDVEFSDAFTAHAAGQSISEVKLDSKQFEKFQKCWGDRRSSLFTDVETRVWIKSCPERNGDEAYRMYKAHPRYNGTKQFSFRKIWGEVRGASVGRPRKSKP